MRNRSIWLGLFAIILLAGCFDHYSPTETRISERLIPLGDYPSSTAVQFYDEVEVAHWDFSDADEVRRWTPERIDILIEPIDTGLRLRSSSPDPSLTRQVDIDSAAVKALRVHQAGLTSDAYMQLYWAGQNDSFSEERTLGASTRDPSGTLIPSYTFRVEDHPAWADRIGRIRIDPTSVADRRIEIYSVIALDFVPNPSLIREVTESPWRVDIRGDVRTAMLTPPNYGFQKTVNIPERASLDFSIGLEPRMSSSVLFEITAQEDHGPVEVIFQETLTRTRNGWHDRKIDLSSFAGKTIDLQFRTSTAKPLDLFRGFPAWANMHVTTASRLKSPPTKNVVLIIADTLRADRLSAYGYEKPTTPNIQRWADEHAVVFEKTVAAAPWTVPSHASLFSGLDCLSHGVNTGDPMPAYLTTIAEVLASQGYATHAVTGGAYLSEAFGLMQGFDVVQYWRPPSGDPADAGDDIGDGLEKVQKFLTESTDRPFFLVFHTYEVHTPYRAREPYFSQFGGGSNNGLIPPVDTLPLEPVREKGYVMRAGLQARFGDESSPYQPISDSDLSTVNALYDSGVAYADHHIGQLLDQISSLNLDHDTIVVMTSDHGESLGEHGHFEHKRLNEQELLVPLIIASPDHSPRSGSRVSAQVRLIDVMPTILELVDLPAQSDVDGRSLVPLLADPTSSHPKDAWSYASSSNTGLALRRDNRLKYIFNNTVWPQVYGRQELYDLENDPRADTNLAPDDSRTPPLYTEAAEIFDQRTSGVRIRFSNHSDDPMEAHLKGHIVDPLRVKGFGVETDFLEWRYQMLNMVVPPRHSMVFHIEGNPFGELYATARFDVPSDTRTGIKHVMNLHQYAGPWQATFDGRRWHEELAEDLDEATGIKIWIQGPHGDPTSPTTIDQESRLLLQKLGYIH